MMLPYHIQIRMFEYKTFVNKSIYCNKTKYVGNDGIKIALMFRNFQIKNH